MLYIFEKITQRAILLPTFQKVCVHARKQRSQNLACTDITGLQLHYRPIVLHIFENMTPRAIICCIFQKVYVHAWKHKRQNLACTDIRGLHLHYRAIVLYIFENITPRALMLTYYKKTWVCMHINTEAKILHAQTLEAFSYIMDP